MSFLSGASGWDYLTDGKNNVIIFSDIHSNDSYCPGTQLFIDEWLDQQIDFGLILLEEVKRKNVILKDLWKAKHTQKLKNWYLKNAKHKNVVPIDIRNLFIPFSWQLYPKKIQNKVTLKYYLQILYTFLFFDVSNKSSIAVLCDIIHDIRNKLNKLKLKAKYRTGLTKHFNLIRTKFFKLCQKHKTKMNTTIDQWIGDFIPWIGNYLFTNKSLPLLTEIEEILSAIMEWYTILNLLSSDVNYIIIHAGLAHTYNINYLLKHIYSFKNTGKEEFKESSCVFLSPEFEDDFKHNPYNKN